jgi:glycine cleavage system aminomethyltransferase T
MSLAQGYLPKELVSDDVPLQVEVLGIRRNAKILHEPAFDPQGTKMRS